jgi:hypothetical protein
MLCIQNIDREARPPEGAIRMYVYGYVANYPANGVIIAASTLVFWRGCCGWSQTFVPGPYSRDML